MLARSKCAGCGTRSAGKLASLYWAWFKADGVRTAWKQRLCVSCTIARLSKVLSHSQDQSEDLTMCPSCGTDSSADLDPIYLTLYVPGREKHSADLSTCAVCATHLRVTAQENAMPLSDRSSSGAGSSATDPWDALGLAPPQ
jgi:hypothetical protein